MMQKKTKKNILVQEVHPLTIIQYCCGVGDLSHESLLASIRAAGRILAPVPALHSCQLRVNHITPQRNIQNPMDVSCVFVCDGLFV